MGRVAGSYGVRGWIRVAPHSGDPQGLLGLGRWHVGAGEYAVEAARAHSGALLAKLGGVDSREAARRLKGAAVRVPRAALPQAPSGTYYWSDLVGLEVVNTRGAELGAVKRMFHNGAHDVMELAGAGPRLVPWVAQVVRRVDLEAGRIEVDWEADW
jgi:16S rRNA processing protein RimM